MAIYKRYNTRKKRFSIGWLVWGLFLAAVFCAAVLLGWHLGEKAAGGEDLLPSVSGGVGDSETITPLAERILRGEYVEPHELKSFTTEAPFTYASTWLYREGSACFATETDRKLGRDVSALPALSTFAIEAGTTALFSVKSVYADAQIRPILHAYETSLLAEFAAAGPSEIVLVFDRLDAECRQDIFAFATGALENAVLCVPYSVLESEDHARFFAEAAEAGLTVALLAEGLSAEQLAADIEHFSFYFTRYELRLVLDGKDAALLSTLRENNVLNYQFCSPRADDAANGAS